MNKKQWIEYPVAEIFALKRQLPAAENWSFEPPLHSSTSYSMPSVEDWEDFLSGEKHVWCYSSDEHPTGAELGRLLASIQGRERCMLTSTGKSAISYLLHSLLRPGDGVLIFTEAYKSTRFYAERLLSQFGVYVFVHSLDDRSQIEQLIRSGAVQLLMLESPTNPQTRVPDIHYFCELAHRNGTIVALDNSMSGFHQHGDLPVDLFVHSLSKFASAGADVMGGAIIGDDKLISQIRRDIEWGTDVLDPRAAHSILKGMSTYWMRRERQAGSASKIAEYLSTHPRVSRALYPGLTSHPDHRHAMVQMKDFGVLISFDIDGDEAAMKRVVNATKHFRIAFGSAFPTSVIAPCWLFYARAFPEGENINCAINRRTIRLSIGLEESQALIEDLDQAIRCI